VNTLAPSAFASALRAIDDGIDISLDGDDVKITASLSAQCGYAKIATVWQKRELTPEFLAELSFQLGQIATNNLLPTRNWYYVGDVPLGFDERQVELAPDGYKLRGADTRAQAGDEKRPSLVPRQVSKCLSHERLSAIRDRAERGQNLDTLALLDHIADRAQVNERAARMLLQTSHEEQTDLETRLGAAEAENIALRGALGRIREIASQAVSGARAVTAPAPRRILATILGLAGGGAT
jgi:hypothetical protein